MTRGLSILAIAASFAGTLFGETFNGVPNQSCIQCGPVDTNAVFSLYGGASPGSPWVSSLAHAQDLAIFTAPLSTTFTHCTVYVSTGASGAGFACGIATLSGTILGQCAVAAASVGVGSCALGSSVSVVAGTSYYQIASSDSTVAAVAYAIDNLVIALSQAVALTTNGHYVIGRANTSSTGTGASLALANFASVVSPLSGYASAGVYPAVFTN